MDYLATDRLPVEEIIEGATVYVPEWKSGSVIGWTHGVVIEIHTPRAHPRPEDIFYIVRLDNGREQGYYAWSIGRPVR